MRTSEPGQRILAVFTSEQWNGKPVRGSFNMFIGFLMMGYVVSLPLMIFIAGLGSLGAATLFAILCAVLVTVLFIRAEISRQRKFLDGVATKVNNTILQLTGNPGDRLSADKLRSFIKTGNHLPLLVNGIPGLDLSVVQHRPPVSEQKMFKGRLAVVSPVEAIITTTLIVLTITPPDYGISSFDNLLDSVAGAD